uniref:Helicase ATP-binding domain-containing protein n=1 Tax=viral metagenome TaxID=1070528 RepID=A0A6C0D7E6_9ZZZZ
MNNNKVLTHKGYSIRKSFLSEKNLKMIMDSCNVEPKTDDRFKIKGEIGFKIYKESPERYYLPREWAITKFGEPEVNLLSEGSDLSDDHSLFKGTPYDYQKDIINTYLQSKKNGLICVPCGKGKTFMALNIASQIKKKFLIVVDKEFLMNQWKNEISSVMPNLKVGILQADVRQVGSETIPANEPSLSELKKIAKENKIKVSGSKEEIINRLKEANVSYLNPPVTIEYDCTICMIQTLCIQTFPENFFKDYGFTIFDECHHLGAQHFCKALFKIQTNKLLGLSATPVRADGLTKVFEMFLGKPLFWEKVREPDPTVIVKGINITCQDPDYLKIPYDYKRDVIIPRLITYIVECKERNQEIARWICSLAEDVNRKILVLSARIAHLNEIEKLLPKTISTSYYIGGMKEEVRESGAIEAKVLLASYSMASEAMNIKSLNSVILASPRTNVEQSTGRILRTRISERVIQPMIIDIIDPHDPLMNQWRSRKNYYKKCEYSIEIVQQGNNDGIKETSKKSEIEVSEGGCLFTDD